MASGARDDSWVTGEALGSGSSRHLKTLVEHWLLIVVCVVAAVVATLIYAGTAQKRYEAHAQIVVTPLPSNSTVFLGINSLLRDSTQGEPVVTAAQLLRSAA